MNSLWSFRIARGLLLSGLAALLASLPMRGQERMRLERKDADGRFHLRPTYRAPGQRKLCLALRGGSAKGLAHLGIFAALDSENIPVDALVGTSAGSLMGSLYASGFSGEGLARIFRSQDFGAALDDRRREPGWSLSEDEQVHASPFGFAFRNGKLDLLPGGTRSRRTRMALMPLLGRAAWLAGGNFDRLRMPLRVVTTDLTAGQGRVFASGSLVDVVMASTCLPGIFEPVMIDGHQYVDGGPYENLPVMVARKAFPDMVHVGVAIGRPWNMGYKENALTLLDASLDMAMAQTEARSQKAADMVIRPDMESSQEFDFYSQVDALAAVGREAFAEAREKLEQVIYGPEGEQVVASSLMLQAPNVEGAPAWLASLQPQGTLKRRDLWRILRRAYGDLPIADAEVILPRDAGGQAVLVLQRSPLIRSVVIDVPTYWSAASKRRVARGIQEEYHLAPGQPFNEGAWNRAQEELLVLAVLNKAPILELQGSEFRSDGTLVMRVREPRITRIRVDDPDLAPPLERFLDPLRTKVIRTPELEEALNRASTRLGLSRLLPDFREDNGNLDLVLKPQAAPTMEIQPQLAYESTWGGHLGLDIRSPNFVNTGAQLQLHGAINDLQSVVQGHLLGVFRSLPSIGIGLQGGLLRQWFPEGDLKGYKIVRGDGGLRIQGRFGMEDRGLLQVDLGETRGYAQSPTTTSATNRAEWFKTSFEWDSFDYHSLPTEGFLVRGSVARGFHADVGPEFSESYLRMRKLWPHLGSDKSILGLDMDLEVALQHNAPPERWFVVGGTDSMIGSQCASYLVPNIAFLRTGIPFTAATLFGVAIQAVPRLDIGRQSLKSGNLMDGQRLLGSGLVLRGFLKSLYMELSFGQVQTSTSASLSTVKESHLGFLVGTHPFDIWKGR